MHLGRGSAPLGFCYSMVRALLSLRLHPAEQEALASELAARMNAMNSASDNAKELRKKLTRSYNRVRQAKITSQIIEICSGAQA